MHSYINKSTLAREGVLLACTVLKGRHTHDLIASTIHDINVKYKIHNKIVSTTTDNGSNFIKAFKVFGVSENSSDRENMIDDDIEFIALADLDQVDLNTEYDFGDLSVQLSTHRRCVSHTLSLIAAHNVEKWFCDNHKQNDVLQLRRLHRKLFAKLSKIWSKQNQSTLIAQYIHDGLNEYLKVPNKTR